MVNVLVSTRDSPKWAFLLPNPSIFDVVADDYFGDPFQLVVPGRRGLVWFFQPHVVGYIADPLIRGGL